MAATRSNLGKYLLLVSGGTGLVLSAICFPFVLPAFRRVCLPFVPATVKQVEHIFVGLRNRSGSFIDLGSGDGRLVLEAAQRNFKPAVGVELNSALLIYSKIRAFSLNVHKNTTFCKRDLWKVNLSSYDNIVLFGVEEMMCDMERKFKSECSADCALAICRFPLPTMTPAYQIGTGIDIVWFYQFKKK